MDQASKIHETALNTHLKYIYNNESHVLYIFLSFFDACLCLALSCKQSFRLVHRSQAGGWGCSCIYLTQLQRTQDAKEHGEPMPLLCCTAWKGTDKCARSSSAGSGAASFGHQRDAQELCVSCSAFPWPHVHRMDSVATAKTGCAS